MRRTLSVSSLMLIAVGFLTACGGGDGTTDPGTGSPNPSPTGTSRMTATIDGQSWSANTATGSVTAVQFSPKSGGYIIGGIGSGVAASVVFTLNLITRTGT